MHWWLRSCIKEYVKNEIFSTQVLTMTLLFDLTFRLGATSSGAWKYCNFIYLRSQPPKTSHSEISEFVTILVHALQGHKVKKARWKQALSYEEGYKFCWLVLVHANGATYHGECRAFKKHYSMNIRNKHANIIKKTEECHKLQKAKRKIRLPSFHVLACLQTKISIGTYWRIHEKLEQHFSVSRGTAHHTKNCLQY